MPPRRRSSRASLASDGETAASSDSSPPAIDTAPAPARKRTAPAKKARNSDVDSSLDLSDRKMASKPAAKAKRKRVEDEEAESVPKKGKVAAGKRGTKANTSQESPRRQSSDSDMFEFTTEAYNASQQTSLSQPLTRKQPNGKAPAPKAASQPLPARATAADKGKQRAADMSATSKGKATAAGKSRAAMPPPPAPAAPTTPRRTHETSKHDSTVMLGVADTPMQDRNIAMRKAADSAPSTSRRTSFERRGRRSSFVGDGFEAIPHHTVADDQLYRHLNPEELPSVRFLTLLSWAAQRHVKRLVDDPPAASSSKRALHDGVVKGAEGLIANIAARKLQLRWSDHAAPAKSRNLIPNSENQSNKDKRDALSAWTDRMNEERNARSSVKPRYMALQAPRKPSSALISVPTTTVDFAAPLPKLRTADDVFSYGKSLLEKAQANPQPLEKASEVDVEAELSISFNELRLQAASLRQSTHRVDQLARLGQSYANTRVAAVHRALESLTTGDPPMPDAHDMLRALTRAELPPPRR